MKRDRPQNDLYNQDSFSGYPGNDGDSINIKSLYQDQQFLKGDFLSNCEFSMETQKNEAKIQKKKQKQQVNDQNIENHETKNLPSFFLRQFCDHILSLKDLCPKIKKKIRRTKQESQTKASISQIRSILQNDQINRQIKEYITSFQIVDDLLNSPKLLDVQTPIKYLEKLFDACNNPASFTSWK